MALDNQYPMINTAIIGSGFGGIAVARCLKRQGRNDFVVLDSQAGPGGVWQAHRFPGCAADMPSLLYCYADRVPPPGTRLVPDRTEILRYLGEVIKENDLEPHLRFGWTVSKVERHNDDGGWLIRSPTGDLLHARYVVIATGTTGSPRMPKLPGIADFKGPLFHTMEWPETIAVAGLRIAVIGAGASAIQLVPELVRQNAKVTVFARTHRWILPKPDLEVNGMWRAALGLSPGLRGVIGDRLARYVDRRAKTTMFADPQSLAALDAKYRRKMQNHIGPWEGQLPLPDVPFGCTRTLFSNAYFPALRGPNVILAPEARTIHPDSIVDVAGESHAADMIVLATGADRFSRSIAIIRRDGTSLYEEWGQEPKALAGILPAGTPNLFHMSGPNSGVLNAAPRVLEAQADCIVRLMSLADASQRSVVASHEAVDAFQASLRPRLDRTIWATSHCRAWYTEQFAQNPVIWPGSLGDYRAMLNGLSAESLLR